MSWTRPILIAMGVTGSLLGSAAAASPDYHLGPQDQLQVRVYDLRTGTGEAYQWTAFNGDFTVGASGQVSLPLIGDLQASGRTTADLGKAISERLQAKVGLAEKPDASVQVTKYRPFYIMGEVEKPGEYDYRPGLMVMQAVSTAGGLTRPTGDAMMSYTRDALVSRGELRLLAADRLDLLARQARLDAQIKGASTITFPDALMASANDGYVSRIMREERLLFEARRDSLVSQSAALTQSKDLLQHEILALAEKDVTLGRQLDLNQKELDQVAGLVAKGLTILPRQLELQRTTSQFQSDRLDIQLAKLRANEGIAKADQDILELNNKARNDALQEAGDVRNKLAETVERSDTSQSLLFNSEVRAPASLSTNALGSAEPDYVLIRRIDGKTETLPVQEGDLVEPGDVVRVEPKAKPTTADVDPTSNGAGSGSRSAMRF